MVHKDNEKIINFFNLCNVQKTKLEIHLCFIFIENKQNIIPMTINHESFNINNSLYTLRLTAVLD